MKNYEILAGNNLLADFMGATFNIETLNKGEIWLPQHGVCKYKTVELGKGKILEYHKSWNWLMPVVQKIKSIDESEFNYHVNNMTKFRLQKESLLSMTIDTDLLTLYSQIVDFIKWYNDVK